MKTANIVYRNNVRHASPKKMMAQVLIASAIIAGDTFDTLIPGKMRMLTVIQMGSGGFTAARSVTKLN